MGSRRSSVAAAPMPDKPLCSKAAVDRAGRLDVELLSLPDKDALATWPPVAVWYFSQRLAHRGSRLTVRCVADRHRRLKDIDEMVWGPALTVVRVVACLRAHSWLVGHEGDCAHAGASGPTRMGGAEATQKQREGSSEDA